jgi:MFS family permease
VKGSEAYNEALMKEAPQLWNLTTWKLFGCLILGCFAQTMVSPLLFLLPRLYFQTLSMTVTATNQRLQNGFDGSVFGGLTANQTFLDYFHGTNDGPWAALNSAMYQIGGVCALFFVGPAIDTWGRKIGMQIGAWIIIVGSVINGTTALSANLGQLKAGRFILGFGVSIVSAAGPIYVVETAHPAYRGIITAYCNTFWFTGSILASGAIRGAITLEGNKSWTIPVYLQMFFPGLIVLLAWFIPESPRWLYVNHKREKAVAVLTKYHGYGNEDSAWVKLQLEEYEAYLNM